MKAAKSQSRRALTTEQVAKALNVKVRGVYKTKEILRLRPDLAEKIVRGEMTTHAAWREATGKPKNTTRDRLWSAWNAASDQEKGEFVAMIWERFGGPDD